MLNYIGQDYKLHYPEHELSSTDQKGTPILNGNFITVFMPPNSCQLGSLSDLYSQLPHSPLLPRPAMEELLDLPTVKTLPDPHSRALSTRTEVGCCKFCTTSQPAGNIPTSPELVVPNEAFMLTSRKNNYCDTTEHCKKCTISRSRHLLWHADANSLCFLH